MTTFIIILIVALSTLIALGLLAARMISQLDGHRAEKRGPHYEDGE